MKKLLTLAAWLISFLSSFEQNVAINNSSVPPDASAMLDVSSSSKGLLVPRMTQVQRATISNPAKGLLVYQTDTDSGFYFNAGSAIAPNWIPLQSQLTGWSTKGNAGTTANNFLGTLDESPLRFRYHNLNAGMIDSISFNTGIGFRSFDSLTTGQHNSNFGYKTLITNSTGNRNTALGSNALRFNTTGTHNVAAGMQALVLNTTGNSNVAIGQNALGTNSDRSNLVAVGDSALYNNGFGASAAFHATANTAIGSKAMYGNQTGYRNTALGYTSLYGNNSGTNN